MTRLSASESSKMSLSTMLLRMEERISALEQRPAGQQGPSDGHAGVVGPAGAAGPAGARVVGPAGAGAAGRARDITGGNIAPEVVRTKAARGNDGNKQKWEDHQGGNNNNNRNNNYHHQHNKRQETVRAYADALVEGMGYAGNLPLCNRCKLHHTSPCTVRCKNCQKGKRTLQEQMSQEEDSDSIPSRHRNEPHNGTRKYMEKGCQVFPAHVTEKNSTEKRLEDVPIVRDFPEVFPKDL
ncbi:hypothetical protein Tco_1147511 [Tanacetum coccineum]